MSINYIALFFCVVFACVVQFYGLVNNAGNMTKQDWMCAMFACFGLVTSFLNIY